MANNFSLTATSRENLGKGASRRLRREGLVPAVVYGGESEPVSISLKLNEVTRNLMEEAFYASIIDLVIDGKKEDVILRDLQRHPVKPFAIHVDLQRVQANVEIHVVVPLNFINEETAHGVKVEGGMLQRVVNDVEIICLPRNLPESIDVDVANLKLGESLHMTDLIFPEGVQASLLIGSETEDDKTREEHNHAVVSFVGVRGEEASDDEDAPVSAVEDNGDAAAE